MNSNHDTLLSKTPALADKTALEARTEQFRCDEVRSCCAIDRIRRRVAAGIAGLMADGVISRLIRGGRSQTSVSEPVTVFVAQIEWLPSFSKASLPQPG
jgi:hypothetical protein